MRGPRRAWFGWPGAAALALTISAAAAPPALAGTISTVAGNGLIGYSGDGGPATAAELHGPTGVAVLPGGGFVIADAFNGVIREVSATGTITTVAGDGRGNASPSYPCGYSGDGGPATAAELCLPVAVAATASGGLLIVDQGNNVIREVSPAGIITTVAGNGTAGFGGDGGPATAAELHTPTGVAALPDGGFLIMDWGNSRVREVSASGTITTVAGDGRPGYSGDGGPATSAEIDPSYDASIPYDSVAALPAGGFLITDETHVREVSAAGVITTVAGDGRFGYTGDGGPATSAELSGAAGVAPTAGGGFLIADTDNNVIRQVSPAGFITTVAGNGTAGFRGEDCLATTAEFLDPTSVSPTPDGGFLVADSSNSVIRKVTPGSGPACTPPIPVLSGLRLNPSAFSAHGHTTATYRDSESALTTFLLEKPEPGVRRQGRCQAPPRHLGKHVHRCQRLKPLGSLRHQDTPGINHVPLSGVVNGRALRPGVYIVFARADFNGYKSRVLSASFRITK